MQDCLLERNKSMQDPHAPHGVDVALREAREPHANHKQIYIEAAVVRNVLVIALNCLGHQGYLEALIKHMRLKSATPRRLSLPLMELPPASGPPAAPSTQPPVPVLAPPLSIHQVWGLQRCLVIQLLWTIGQSSMGWTLVRLGSMALPEAVLTMTLLVLPASTFAALLVFLSAIARPPRPLNCSPCRNGTSHMLFLNLCLRSCKGKQLLCCK